MNLIVRRSAEKSNDPSYCHKLLSAKKKKNIALRKPVRKGCAERKIDPKFEARHDNGYFVT